jgi:hypothetical protein
MRHLGDLAFAGKGVAQSYDQAIRWYCQAALVADMDSVDRLEAVGLTSWSARRDALGWEAACEQWLKPPPPPVQTQTSQPSPEVKVEVIVQPEREQYAPAGIWPAYVPRHWRSVNPRHNPRKSPRPRPPVHAPGLYSK